QQCALLSIARRSILSHVDIFQLGVTFECGHAEVTPETALLITTKRRFRMHAAVGIDAEHAAFDRFGNADGPAQVVGPEATPQALLRGINFLDHPVLLVERSDGAPGPENLLMPASVLFADVQQNRPFEVVSLARQTRAAAGKLSPAFPRIGEKLLDH